ncbi:MAG: helix-turn-helix domain-containing protein [Clostridiales bacterium]|nr:helix-turn-helix domain-containing protein [Clostridiales bacterium]
MNTDFPRIMALLRKERGLSQKSAAAELGISQALLSHYEKGVRECGLDFLIRAAAFYAVSTDYLLGISSERRPGERQSGDESGQPDNQLRGRHVASTLGRNLTVSSINVLFGLMEGEYYRDFATGVQQYIGIALYKAFRHLYRCNPNNLQSLFSLPELVFLEAGNAAQQMSELRLKMLSYKMAEGKQRVAPLSYEEIRARYTRDAPAFFSVMKRAEEEIRQVK